jgi:hypothetical protein
MLPGFRFLFAAIALSVSILVFGLGAAALLRAAHEEFASIPSWHAAPETTFVTPGDTGSPVLAMLRAEPPAAEPKALDNVAAATAPVQPTEPSVMPSPVELETTAALKPEEPSSPETARASPETARASPETVKAWPETTKAEIPVAESPTRDEPAPAQADVAAPTGQTNTGTADTKVAASEAIASPPNEPATLAALPEPAAAKPGVTATKIVALSSGPTIGQPQPNAKVSIAKPDKDAIKKRLQARQAIRRRKIALRARLVQQAQQPADPFAQPVTATPKR